MKLLNCDGHDGHVTVKFLQLAMDHGIVISLLIPHSSHLCQSSDVGVFGHLKMIMSDKLEPIHHTEILHIQKAEWLTSYARVRS